MDVYLTVSSREIGMLTQNISNGIISHGECVPPVRVSSGGESGWGEAGMYGPPEPVAAAIKV